MEELNKLQGLVLDETVSDFASSISFICSTK